MYFVDDNCIRCGFYECKECGYRFLSEIVMPKIPCPNCAADIDYEIGPDESMEELTDTAILLEVVEGNENVRRYDTLLSCAFVDNEDWID